MAVPSGEVRYKGVKMLPWGSYTAEFKDSSQRRFVWLGTFDTAEEAARAYDTAARQYLSPRTILNFPSVTKNLKKTKNFLRKLNRKNAITNNFDNDIGSSSKSGCRFLLTNQNSDDEFRRFTTITGASVMMSMVRDKDLLKALMKEGVILQDPKIMDKGANNEPLNLELSLAPPGNL